MKLIVNRRATRIPCGGSVHVIPTPPGTTTSDAWAELTIMGRFGKKVTETTGCCWAVVECPGAESCTCRNIELGRTYRRYHNDRLVAATPLGILLHLFKGRK